MAHNPTATRQRTYQQRHRTAFARTKEATIMANMSYCRFHNTLEDLRDCYDNMDDGDMSEAEKQARKRLIQLCREIADNYGDLEDEA
jgi:hypothetical protein